MNQARKTREWIRFACTCQRRAVWRPNWKCSKGRKQHNRSPKTNNPPTRTNRSKSESKNTLANNCRWPRPACTQKWRRTFSRAPRNNADSVERKQPTVTTWNKSERAMSLWQGSWNAIIATRTGGIDWFCGWGVWYDNYSMFKFVSIVLDSII